MTNSRLTACAFLRCKNDSYEDPMALETDDGTVDNRIYWCGKTLKAYGPDDEEALLETCQPGRDCHCQTVEGNALPLDPIPDVSTEAE